VSLLKNQLCPPPLLEVNSNMASCRVPLSERCYKWPSPPRSHRYRPAAARDHAGTDERPQSDQEPTTSADSQAPFSARNGPLTREIGDCQAVGVWWDGPPVIFGGTRLMDAVSSSRYKGHRYPAEVISHCVWLYHRFPLSFREVEEMMLARGVVVSYETPVTLDTKQLDQCQPIRS
jgi:hypothetical protein